MRRCIILLTVFSWVLAISAQENSREKTAKGSYTYEIPKNMSYEQACQFSSPISTVSRVQTSILPPVAQ